MARFLDDLSWKGGKHGDVERFRRAFSKQRGRFVSMANPLYVSRSPFDERPKGGGGGCLHVFLADVFNDLSFVLVA